MLLNLAWVDIRRKDLNTKYGVAFAEGGNGEEDDAGTGMLLINPDECINCGACETECPVEAIYEDSAVPTELSEFIKVNEEITLALSDAEMEKTRCTSK